MPLIVGSQVAASGMQTVKTVFSCTSDGNFCVTDMGKEISYFRGLQYVLWHYDVWASSQENLSSESVTR